MIRPHRRWRLIGLPVVTLGLLSLLGSWTPRRAALPAAALAFSGVTVIDVTNGERRPNQTVVIVGNRIQSVGPAQTVRLPADAQLVDARGKYLIPGLWDMHVHPMHETALYYPLFLANGVTGFRDAGSPVSTDTLRGWLREILAGARVGPPRQLFSGRTINVLGPKCRERQAAKSPMLCITDVAEAVGMVDSFRRAGVDAIKIRMVGRSMYFAIAAEARRLGIPFGGHAEEQTAIEASDSGAVILDHMPTGDIDALCIYSEVPRIIQMRDKAFGRVPRAYVASVERCREVAARFARNGTWWVPTMVVQPDMTGPSARPIVAQLRKYIREFWLGSVLNPYTPDSTTSAGPYKVTVSDSNPAGRLRIAQAAGLPILAGTDVLSGSGRRVLPGFMLHAELAVFVAEGLTPLNALQTATLNPAKMLRATDSLGTVAPGKLADLVLLDADPLENIANITTIRAVVANGRYYDRAALDGLLAEVQAKANEGP